MRYCPTTTLNHITAITFRNCVVDINTLILREGCIEPMPYFVNNEAVIDLDLAEAENAIVEGRLEKNKSMDMAFGITDPSGTRKQMLLVEFKFNATTMYSIHKNDLEEKVLSSSLLLGGTPDIRKTYFFVFQTRFLQEAINRFFRIVPKLDSNYFVIDIQTLKSEFFL